MDLHRKKNLMPMLQEFNQKKETRPRISSLKAKVPFTNVSTKILASSEPQVTCNGRWNINHD